MVKTAALLSWAHASSSFFEQEEKLVSASWGVWHQIYQHCKGSITIKHPYAMC
jgi:hypothetical protein